MTAEVLRTRTSAEWLARLDRESVPCAPVLDARAGDRARAGARERGDRGARAPASRAATASRARRRASPRRPRGSARHAPLLGEHTAEIARELGVSPAELEALLARRRPRRAGARGPDALVSRSRPRAPEEPRGHHPSEPSRSARKSASPSRAASTRAPPCTGCARRARSRTPTPRTSASPTSPTTTRSRAGAAVRRREGAPDRLPARARAGGHRGAAVRRVPHLHRGRPVLQHHAARPRRHRHAARRRDEGRRRQHLGRRQHVQGQRHRALLPLRPAREPEPAHLQAVARPGVHRRARRPQGDVRVHGARRLRVPDERREGVLDRLEPARRDARSEGPRAPQHRHQDRRADHGRRVLARGRGRASPRRSRSASRRASRSR